MLTENSEATRVARDGGALAPTAPRTDARASAGSLVRMTDPYRRGRQSGESNRPAARSTDRPAT